MRRILTSLAGVAILATAGHAQFAESVIGPKANHWEFSEAANTTLTGTSPTIGASNWIYDIGYHENNDIQTSFTTGTGAFNIRRPGAGYNVNSFAANSASGASILYAVADVSWDYSLATAVGQDFRFGFHNTTAPQNTTSLTANPPVTIFAEMVLRRNSAGVVQIGAWGADESGGIIISPTATTGPAANTALYTTVGGDVQANPVRLVLALDMVNRVGSVHFSMDGGSTYTTVGGNGHSFALNDTWAPNQIRLGAINNFQSPGPGDPFGSVEGSPGLFIHDLYVAIPEPSTYALFAGLGILGLAIWRRSRKSAA